MKRLLQTSLALLLCNLLVASFNTSFAQTVNAKIVAMSPGMRSSGPPNYTAPAGPNYISTGLHVFGKGMKAYLTADTTGSGTHTVTSFTWAITGKPTGSNAVLDSTNKKSTSFLADSVGQYIVTVTVNGGASSADTLFASTYLGTTACATCHSDKNATWQTTLHATMFKNGVTGNLEVANGKGTYGNSCIKCHTTGWEPSANNGNFGALVHVGATNVPATSWDSTWYKTYGTTAMVSIPTGDQTAWNALPAAAVPVATIGCESCHGPGGNHYGDITKIDKSLNAGVCLQCHDAPAKHLLGSYWASSLHATLPSGSDANSTSCFPCHSGSAFVKWQTNKSNPGYVAATDAGFPITCSACHDPHGNGNDYQLRTMAVDSLKNGYKPTVGGKGQLCMNCHQARYAVSTRVTNVAPYYGFASHYGPHEGPQADMFLGQNAYEFGKSLSVQTHGSVPDGCVTCHMATRVNGSSSVSNHEMVMDSSGVDITTACTQCHGPIQSFNDIKASADYDGNGKIEGVQTEIQGMLNLLKSKLPLDSTGEPVTMMSDSLKVKNHPEYIGAIYDYYFVKNDGSLGVHNVKYTVAILNAAISSITGVPRVIQTTTPKTFDVSQNYPNPFNPTTQIRFTIPSETSVKITVFNLAGEEVSTLASGTMEAGTHTVTWNGCNESGQAVSTGVYFYRVQAGDYMVTKKMLFLK
jgi:predicted CXXCH cytochrome family protein